jgi:predicted DNA-binding transcriptional regulator AlpA
MPTTTEKTPEELLTEHDVAQLLKVSVATIRRRRLFRQPPAYLKIGASVRYRRAAIQRLIESAEHDSETR